MNGNRFDGKVVALCGGVGGAKLAWGLAQSLAPEQLTIIVNTADDCEHLGLHISPDLDTVMYTLAGLNNRELGWGLQGESWQCMTALAQLGGETWFRLGDRDLATNLLRTQLLAQGNNLTDVTARLCAKLGVQQRLLPMCDEAIRTLVDTDDGELAFQDYFVRRQCQPTVRGVRYRGQAEATLSTAVSAALRDPALRSIIICPSNPLLSIAPILAVPGLRAQLATLRDKVIVVSPLISGQAIKGPTAKMMQEMAIPANAASIAGFYADLLGCLVLDSADRHELASLPEPGKIALLPTLMQCDADKHNLATRLLALAG